MADEDDGPLSFGAGVALRDILDYIGPGGAFILCGLAFDLRLSAASSRIHDARGTPHAPFATLLQAALPTGPSPDWLASLAFLALTLGIAYVVGHIVGSVSAFLIERSFVFKAYDWPYRQLFAVQDANPQDDQTSRLYYRAGFFWFNVFAVSFYAFLLLRLASPAPWFLRIPLLLMVLLSGVLIVTLTCGRVLSVIYKGLDAYGVKGRFLALYESPRRRRFRDLFALLAAFPYELFAGAFARLLSTSVVFDQQFREKFRGQFARLFEMQPENARSNTFWLTYCFVVQKAPAFSGMLNHWRMQYSFARNLSAAVWLIAAYGAVSVVWQGALVSSFNAHDRNVVGAIPVLFFGIATIMLVRYYYLFASYFSRFVFRAFVYLNCVGPSQ